MSWADGPTVAPYPMKVKRAPAEFSAKHEETLQAEFRKLLREAGVELPNTLDRKSTRLNSSHNPASRMPSSA
jgi:hypothetical protein